MLRILQKTATLGPGGIQKFLIEVQRNVDGRKIKFDYFLNTTEHDFFTDEAIRLGSRIFGRKKNTGNPFLKLLKRCRLFYRTLRKEKYRIVHIDETLEMTAVSIIIARLAGVPVIIAHAHNDHASDIFPWYKKHIIHPFARFITSNLSTHRFACSEIAAKWFFTKKTVSGNNYSVINNGIHSELYEYNPDIEKEYRARLGLGDSLVIGHVGRFFYQKNHKFILETFSEIKKIKKNSKLLLIGEGELMDKMKSYAKRLGIAEDVIFYGVSDEVNRIIQTFDAFIFPSRYEGLGIVAIEAQAASVHTFCASETIAKEVNITPYCHYIPLKSGQKKWAEEIVNVSENYKKISMTQKIISAKYDIATVAGYLEKFYLSEGKDR